MKLRNSRCFKKDTIGDDGDGCRVAWIEKIEQMSIKLRVEYFQDYLLNFLKKFCSIENN